MTTLRSKNWNINSFICFVSMGMLWSVDKTRDSQVPVTDNIHYPRDGRALRLFTVPLFFRGILETGRLRWSCRHLAQARSGETV